MFNYRMVISPALALLLSTGVLADELILSSPDIAQGQKLTEQQVFNGFGCTGVNQSPSLQWQGAPAGTKSFAVTVYDLDAPTGSGWWHWVVFDLPSTTNNLSRNAGSLDLNGLPKGAIQSRTDFGTAAFGGACPPKGDVPHRYIFTVWALDVEKLGPDANASAAMVGFMLNQHKLTSSTIEAWYHR